MKKLLEDFKKFILHGNVIDLAVAFVMAAAFKAVVDTLVNSVILPLVSAIFGKPSFDDLTVGIGDGVVKYGTFLTAVVQFVIIGLSMFVLVKTFETMQSLRKRGVEATPEELTTDQELLTEIRDLLRVRQ